MTREEQLLDFRRAVASMYARVRDPHVDAAVRCQQFRHQRDHLFRSHPQSALSDKLKAAFTGLRYYPYDPAFRFELLVEPVPGERVIEMELQEDGLLRMRRFGQIRFQVSGQDVSLTLYWIMGYGGGLFLPFGDLTNRGETYGGGRYLLDTIKHADLGHEESRLVIDFNYAYNPSCAYDARWYCPLSPAENRLPVTITAGEKSFSG